VSGNSILEEKNLKPLSRMRQFLPVFLFVGWLLLMVLPPFSLWMLRSSWLEELDSPNVQAEWNEFRDDMKKQSDRSGPVQHKIPKSPEPPLRVWLRDYFWLAVAAWGILGSALYGFFSVAVVGVTRSAVSSCAIPTVRD
jgi:fatty acid desaturase